MSVFFISRNPSQYKVRSHHNKYKVLGAKKKETFEDLRNIQ